MENPRYLSIFAALCNIDCSRGNRKSRTATTAKVTMAQASETVTETESSSTASLTLSKPPAGAEKEIYLKDYAPYPYVIDEVRYD